VTKGNQSRAHETRLSDHCLLPLLGFINQSNGRWGKRLGRFILGQAARRCAWDVVIGAIESDRANEVALEIQHRVLEEERARGREVELLLTGKASDQILLKRIEARNGSREGLVEISSELVAQTLFNRGILVGFRVPNFRCDLKSTISHRFEVECDGPVEVVFETT
jgi:hypothetical protein